MCIDNIQINSVESTRTLSNENYVYTIQPQVETTDISSLEDDEKIESVSYFDGLGRSKQQIALRAGGQGQDIITHIGYDDFGRQTKDYLPYVAAGNGGFFHDDPLTELSNLYNQSKYENTSNPYSEKHFEASPLNRVLEQAAPGEDWKLNEADLDSKVRGV
jgi:glycogen synthase